jgi:hypothetical protein
VTKAKKPYNPARKVALYCWIGSALGVVMFIYPLACPIETYGAGYALLFAATVVFLSAVISGILFTRLAGKFDAMFSGEGLLAHWTYSPEEWARYAEVEHQRNKAGKRRLFYLSAGITVAVSAALSIVKQETWQVMLFMAPGLIAFMAIVAYVSVVSEHRRNRKHLGEAWIGTRGAVLNRDVHYWKLPASFLHSVIYREGDDPYLELEYSAQAGYGRGFYTARIPIPRGREDEARQVAAALQDPDRAC